MPRKTCASGKRSPPNNLARSFQDDVERALAPVATVRFPYGRDPRSMATGSKPIEELGTDRPAAAGTICCMDRPFASRDDEHDTRARLACDVEPAEQALVGGVERVVVEVQREIRGKSSGAEPALPVRIETALILS